MHMPSTHLSLFCRMQAPGSNDGAWAAFQMRYQGIMLHWCRRRNVTDSDLEDLSQEILVKLYRGIQNYDPTRGPFRTWFRALVDNVVNDHFRTSRRRIVGRELLEDVAGDIDDQSVATDDLAEELMGAPDPDLQRALDAVRTRVKPSTWQAFYLTVVDELPADEAARTLGLSVGAVYQHKYKVNRMIAAEFGRMRSKDQDASNFSSSEAEA